MLVVQILKFSRVNKPPDKQIFGVKKVTCLEWNTYDDGWTIIPTIKIGYNLAFYITIEWLKVYYSNTWTVITYEDEENYAEFISNKSMKNK